MPCKNHPAVMDNLKACTRCKQNFCSDCIVEIKGQPHCADCKGEFVKDVQSGVTHGELELAGIGTRFAAIFIDGLIMLIPLFAVAFGSVFVLAPVLGTAGGIVLELVIGVLATIPYVLYEGFMLSRGGQTLGKKIMKVKVVTPEGGDISVGQAWTRAIMRSVFNLLRILGLVNYLFAFGQEKTCLHDRIAKTRVVQLSS